MQRLRSWLVAVPGRDAVERRQAYLLQVFLLILVTVFVVGAALNTLSSVINATPNTGFLPNATAAAILAVLVFVLRRGFFRAVAVLAIGFLVYAFAQAIPAASPALAGSYLALLMVPLVLAGLILRRVGLLITAIAVFAAGELAIMRSRRRCWSV
jgi:hypothetical protein